MLEQTLQKRTEPTNETGNVEYSDAHSVWRRDKRQAKQVQQTMHRTLRGSYPKLDLFFIYISTMLTIVAHLTYDTKFTNTSSHRGRRQRRNPLNPPPPARRGQGVPDDFANSNLTFLQTPKPLQDTAFCRRPLPAEIIFSHLRLIFPDFFPA